MKKFNTVQILKYKKNNIIFNIAMNKEYNGWTCHFENGERIKFRNSSYSNWYNCSTGYNTLKFAREFLRK